MKCPHCKTITQQPVLETRTVKDEILRRRRCDVCCKSFVTKEVISELGSIPRPRSKAPSAKEPGTITNDGSHLRDLWR